MVTAKDMKKEQPAQLSAPRSLTQAVRLMYAGAGLTVLGTAADVIAVLTGGTSALRAHHPHATSAQLHATQGALITSVVVSGLLETGIWIFMARANRAGLSWARIIASVLCAISTALLVITMLGSGAITLKMFAVASWVVGAGAIVLLWRPETTAYFRAPVAPSGPAPSAAGKGKSPS